MSEGPGLRIQDWAVEFTFIRTKAGFEFETASHFQHPDASFLCTTYGHYDLIRIQAVEDLTLHPLEIFHSAIEEFEIFRYFPIENSPDSETLLSKLKTHPLSGFISIKVEPDALSVHGIHAINVLASYLRSDALEKEDLFVFAGTGHSELIVLSFCHSLDEIIRVSERIRYIDQDILAPDNEKLLTQKGEDKRSSLKNMVAKTSTAILCSHPKISDHKFEHLQGNCLPIISISSSVPLESNLKDLIEGSFSIPPIKYLSLGYNDIQICWADSFPLSTFSSDLSTFREKLTESPGASFNVSTLFRKYLDEPEQTFEFSPFKPVDVPNNVIENVNRISSNDYIKNKVLSFIGKWQSARNKLLTGHYFSDLDGAIKFIDAMAEEIVLEEARPHVQFSDHAANKLRLLHDLSQAIDIGNNAICQRQASIEANVLINKQHSSPLITDIRCLLAAAQCIPSFIFSKVADYWPSEFLLNGERSDVWTGFVTFGQSLSHQYLPGAILSLPDYSLYEPLKNWWQITHECAHHLFDLFDIHRIYDKHLQTIIEVMEAAGSKQKDIDKVSELLAKTTPYLLNEVFAQWFDYVFLFKKDYDTYLQSIWKSWKNVPRIWESPEVYLLRSFVIFLYSRRNDSSEILRPGFTNEHDDFIESFLKNCGRDSWAEELIRLFKDVENQKDIRMASENLKPYLTFLSSIEEKSGAFYNINFIKNGNVISEGIKNPKELVFSYLKTENIEWAENLQPNIAIIFSLWNYYMLEP